MDNSLPTHRLLTILLVVIGIGVLILIAVLWARGGAGIVSEEAKKAVLSCQEQFADPSMREFCYQEAATKTVDWAACSFIQDITNRDTCYLQLAFQVNNSAACDAVSNQQQKDDCYFRIFLTTGQSGLCDKIRDSAIRKDCAGWTVAP